MLMLRLEAAAARASHLALRLMIRTVPSCWSFRLVIPVPVPVPVPAVRYVVPAVLVLLVCA